MAKGPIVSWLNSDDWILPGAVRHAVEAFSRQPDVGAVYGEGYLVNREGNVTSRFPCTEPLNLWKLVHLSDYILQQTVYFRRAIFDEIGYVREDLNYVMDWDILIRIAKRYGLSYIPEYLGCLREYPEAKSFSGGDKRIREIAGLLRGHTGQRFPPGYIVYGLDTYRQMWCEAIGSRTPAPLRPLSKRVQSLLSTLCGICIERAIVGSQGWYQDRWAGPLVKYMLPAGPDRWLTLSGSIPTRGPQRLNIVADGVKIAQKSFEPGEFEWRVKIPAGSPSHPIHLTFKAARWFATSVREGPVAWRRLSYILKSVHVEPVDEKTPEPPAPLVAGAAAGQRGECDGNGDSRSPSLL